MCSRCHMNINENRINSINIAYKTKILLVFNYVGKQGNCAKSKINLDDHVTEIRIEIDVDSVELKKQTKNILLEEIEHVIKYIDNHNIYTGWIMNQPQPTQCYDFDPYYSLVNEIERKIKSSINTNNFLDLNNRSRDEMTGICFDFNNM